ncbi:hypothetical protein N7468_002638 [Penicillium chermesinum]|uniref:RTA1 domain protein n=1 Tax=Penicillium chermesinum TaxID=63820 RepID=A0A9W9PIY1_9EURO|nr:uncharacterized protein N7468_002638 [Penicillium chermesinum]KAJ5247655.1 hypothetical protein N7468_002638 [Penicillium chermesinum]
MTPSPTATSSPTASATCLNVPPGKNGYLPPEACNAILFYVPSLAAAILFCVLYGLTSGIHIVQAVLYKKKYAWVVIMGGTWELLAFVFRALLTRNQASDTWDTLYTVFFLLAPIWINAFLYMTIGRMLYYYHPDRRIFRISARRFGVIFVCLDIVAFVVQAAGAIMTTNQGGGSIVLDGIHIYMGGIGLQEVFILCFTGLTIQLHRMLIQLEKRGEQSDKLASGPIPWRWLFYSTYFALVMITIRIIFRIAQYAKGYEVNNPV